MVMPCDGAIVIVDQQTDADASTVQISDCHASSTDVGGASFAICRGLAPIAFFLNWLHVAVGCNLLCRVAVGGNILGANTLEGSGSLGIVALPFAI